LILDNLEAATYTVCITSEYMSNFEQCFNIIITDPQNLSLLSSLTNNSYILYLTMSGSKSYTIIHNNRSIKTTNSKYVL
jgi:hypothetical protein